MDVCRGHRHGAGRRDQRRRHSGTIPSGAGVLVPPDDVGARGDPEAARRKSAERESVSSRAPPRSIMGGRAAVRARLANLNERLSVGWLALREPYDLARATLRALDAVASNFLDQTAISVDLPAAPGPLRAVGPHLPPAPELAAGRQQSRPSRRLRGPGLPRWRHHPAGRSRPRS